MARPHHPRPAKLPTKKKKARFHGEHHPNLSLSLQIPKVRRPPKRQPRFPHRRNVLRWAGPARPAADAVAVAGAGEEEVAAAASKQWHRLFLRQR
jgi:hypothetical protein